MLRCLPGELSEQGEWDVFETSYLHSLVPLLMGTAGVVLLFTYTGILLVVLGVTV